MARSTTTAAPAKDSYGLNIAQDFDLTTIFNDTLVGARPTAVKPITCSTMQNI